MASTRLPGKVLADVRGQPLLGIMLRRLRPLAVEEVVVATSTAAVDDPIESFCCAAGVQTVRGDELDVLGRFGATLARHSADTVVRLTADCPLADPAVIAEAIGLHERSGADYTSNTLIRTYPDGLDVEVLSSSALRVADSEASDPVEREHVTPFVYRRPERFRLMALRIESPAGDERWTVDTTPDLALIGQVMDEMPDWPTAGWREILAKVGRRARPNPGELWLRPVVAADKDLLLAWRNDPLTVANSGSRFAVPEADHARWFTRRMNDPGGRIWVAKVDDRPVGYVRVDVRSGVGVVSLAVDSRWRGLGYGSETLRKLVIALAADHQVTCLRAVVRGTNRPSQRAFLATGFSVVSREGDFMVLEWG